MLTAERTRPGAAVETVIHYVDPAAPIGAHHDTDPSRSTLALNAHVVQVQDARPLADSLDLETNGFIFVRSPTAVTNFENREQREGAYYAEARELVRALTGAEEVLVFGDGVRNGAPDAPAGTRAPVFNAHIDYNEDTIRAIARDNLPAEDAQRLLAGRIVLINLWRPITPIESNPLAVCDAASVERGDLVHGPIGGRSLSGVDQAAGYNLAHNPGHRWWYVSDMQPDEVLVFKLCDTDRDRVQWTAHASFHDPNSRPGAAPRRSIELRTLAFFPDQA